MARALTIVKQIIPANLLAGFAGGDLFERLRLPLNILGVLLTAWMSAGIAAVAVASLIREPKETNNSFKTNSWAGNEDEGGSFVSRAAFEVIVERNIFDSANRISAIGKPKNDDFSSRRVTDGPPQLTTLPIKLIGTLVSNNRAFSLATIQESGKPDADQYSIGDRLMGEAKITAIERNRVYFNRNGAKEYVESDDAKLFSPASAPVAAFNPSTVGGTVKEINPGRFAVDKTRVEQVMSNLNEVMTQARVVPHFENGKPSGWKIFAIKPNSIYQELSLENGDIIQRINGTEVDSPAKALEMYQQLASESHVSIDVIRRGAKQTFEYDIR